MIPSLLTLFPILAIFCQPAGVIDRPVLPDNYDVSWKTQSKNASESMPLGGGDVGLNVWVENNDILFYVSQSGAFDENNQLLKHGRVRIKLAPNPFVGATSFEQKLVLKEGNILIRALHPENSVTINLWVDVFSPVVHVVTESKKPLVVTASYESWRTSDLAIPENGRHACFSYSGYPGEVVKYKDSIKYENNSVVWVHRNQEDKLLIDFCIQQQGLSSVRDQIINTQKGRTFGGVMSGTDMKPAGIEKGKQVSTFYTAWKLQTTKPVKKHQLIISLNTGQYESLNEWKNKLLEINKEALTDKNAEGKTKQWWNDFWKRSYVILNSHNANPMDSVWQAGRNYQLFRYLLGCNAYGKYPSKFNGSLFTVDPVFVGKGQNDFDPDHRAWGGGSFTAQNQRLVYWPMLKTGDFDMMPSQFDYYKNALSSAEARTKVYWGHGGACFTEQLENFGLPIAAGWGFESGARKRPPETEWGVQANRYVCHHYINQLEFSLMILDYYQFSGKDIAAYLPFIKSSVRFFDEHYQYRQKMRTGQPLDENGKLVLYPSTAAEMYKIARNPSDVIAALQTVLTRVLDLPAIYLSPNEKKYFQAYLKRVPEIPFDTKEGHKVIKPSESWEYVANQEIPELYPVFPYGVYGLHKPGLDIAMNTWSYGESKDKKKFVDCWSQVGIFAARLGLVNESAHLVVGKLADADRRFPVFWGPGPDWVPDVDHGGAGMINLQEMLMQTDGDKIYLLPTWPKDWDVKFKLHAPGKTVIEAELKDGKLIQLNVSPHERKKDVTLADWLP
jgi:signal peptidase I